MSRKITNEGLATLIADRLFTDGRDKRAMRLRMEFIDEPACHHSPGWSWSAVKGHIQKLLDENE